MATAKKPTLAEVAAACGVSKAAASYVLNGKSGACSISPRTAERVLTTAAELGYRPDAAAQALSALKSGRVRLTVYTPWLYAQYSDFMVRLSAALRKEEGLLVTWAQYAAGRLKETLTPAVAEKADAVLVVGTAREDDRYLARKRREFPNVLPVNRSVEGYPSVCGNDGEAVEALASRVARPGDRGILLQSPAPSSCERERIRAFLRVFPEAEILRVTAAEEVTLPDGEGAPVVFSTQYYPAARLLARLSQRGVRIPEELQLFCYDRHSLLQDFLPMRLTCLDARTEEMTAAAIDAARRIKNGEAAEGRIIPAETVWGESTIRCAENHKGENEK